MSVVPSPNRVLQEVSILSPITMDAALAAHERATAEEPAADLAIVRERCRELLTSYGTVRTVLALPVELELEDIQYLACGNGVRKPKRHFRFRGYDRYYSTELWIPDARLAAWRQWFECETAGWVAGGVLRVTVAPLDLESGQWVSALLLWNVWVATARGIIAEMILRGVLRLDTLVSLNAPSVIRRGAENLIASGCELLSRGGGPSIDLRRLAYPLDRAQFICACEQLLLTAEELQEAAGNWETYEQTRDCSDFALPPALWLTYEARVDSREAVGQWKAVDASVEIPTESFMPLVDHYSVKEAVDVEALAERITELCEICRAVAGQDSVWQHIAAIAENCGPA